MNLLFWGLTFGTIGKVMLALAVLHMHHTLVREHRIDKYVILSYKQERILTFLGVVLIVTGYVMEILFYQPTIMLTCDPLDLNRFLTE
jgi:hypothetical protein